MDIKFMMPSTKTVSGESVSVLVPKTLRLCGQGRPEGSASGLVPVYGTGGTADGLKANVRLEVLSSTSTNKKGAASAVVKVTMPYIREITTEDGQTVMDTSNLGSISVHMVIALPAAAVRDLRDESAKVFPSWEVAQLAQIVIGLLGPRVASPAAVSIKSGVFTPSGILPIFDPTDDASFSANSPTIPHPTDDGLGGVAFDMSTGDTSYRGVDDVLTRIAGGLAPLSCADRVITSIDVPAVNLA